MRVQDAAPAVVLDVWTARLDGAGVTSTAPTSTLLPCGRRIPRWSYDGAPAFVPASTTGLIDEGRTVCVAPPLSANAPSFTFWLSRPAPKEQVLSDEIFVTLLSGAAAKPQLPPAELPATRTFSRFRCAR